jgi:hypothetical protein
MKIKKVTNRTLQVSLNDSTITAGKMTNILLTLTQITTTCGELLLPQTPDTTTQ